MSVAILLLYNAFRPETSSCSGKLNLKRLYCYGEQLRLAAALLEILPVKLQVRGKDGLHKKSENPCSRTKMV